MPRQAACLRQVAIMGTSLPSYSGYGSNRQMFVSVTWENCGRPAKICGTASMDHGRPRCPHLCLVILSALLGRAARAPGRGYFAAEHRLRALQGFSALLAVHVQHMRAGEKHYRSEERRVG